MSTHNMKNKFFFGLVILFLFSLIVNFSGQIIRTWKAGRKLADLETELFRLEEKNRELQTELKRVQGADFIEEEAREKLGMAKEGEKIVILPTSIPGELSEDFSNQPQPKSNWRRWWELFVY